MISVDTYITFSWANGQQTGCSFAIRITLLALGIIQIGSGLGLVFSGIQSYLPYGISLCAKGTIFALMAGGFKCQREQKRSVFQGKPPSNSESSSTDVVSETPSRCEWVAKVIWYANILPLLNDCAQHRVSILSKNFKELLEGYWKLVCTNEKKWNSLFISKWTSKNAQKSLFSSWKQQYRTIRPIECGESFPKGALKSKVIFDTQSTWRTQPINGWHYELIGESVLSGNKWILVFEGDIPEHSLRFNTWDLLTGKFLHSWKVKTSKYWDIQGSHVALFSPTMHKILENILIPGKLEILDLDTGALSTLKENKEWNIRDFSMSSDKQILLYGPSGGYIYDFKTNSPTEVKLEGPFTSSTWCSWGSQNVISWDRTSGLMKIWDPKTGQLTSQFSNSTLVEQPIPYNWCVDQNRLFYEEEGLLKGIDLETCSFLEVQILKSKLQSWKILGEMVFIERQVDKTDLWKINPTGGHTIVKIYNWHTGRGYPDLVLVGDRRLSQVYVAERKIFMQFKIGLTDRSYSTDRRYTIVQWDEKEL